jgi:hypothetical protein
MTRTHAARPWVGSVCFGFVDACYGGSVPQESDLFQTSVNSKGSNTQ